MTNGPLPRRRLLRPLIALLVTAAATATAALPLSVGCCPPGPFRYERGYQQADTPAMAYTMMRRAVQMEGADEADGQSLFYYLLSRDVRAEYPLWQIRQGWGQIKERLGIDVGRSRLLRVDYLDESPFPPRQAARVVVEYPHPEEGVIVENFLLLLELDTRTYYEAAPQWRVYYPYDAYQRPESRIWFRELAEQEPEPESDAEVDDSGE